MKLTVLIEREGNEFVSRCPELNIASQGNTKKEALNNLQEAVELFLEHADKQEIESRLASEVYISQFEASYA